AHGWLRSRTAGDWLRRRRQLSRLLLGPQSLDPPAARCTVRRSLLRHLCLGIPGGADCRFAWRRDAMVAERRPGAAGHTRIGLRLVASGREARPDAQASLPVAAQETSNQSVADRARKAGCRCEL